MRFQIYYSDREYLLNLPPAVRKEVGDTTSLSNDAQEAMVQGFSPSKPVLQHSFDALGFRGAVSRIEDAVVVHPSFAGLFNNTGSLAIGGSSVQSAVLKVVAPSGILTILSSSLLEIIAVTLSICLSSSITSLLIGLAIFANPFQEVKTVVRTCLLKTIAGG